MRYRLFWVPQARAGAVGQEPSQPAMGHRNIRPYLERLTKGPDRLFVLPSRHETLTQARMDRDIARPLLGRFAISNDRGGRVPPPREGHAETDVGEVPFGLSR